MAKKRSKKDQLRRKAATRRAARGKERDQRARASAAPGRQTKISDAEPAAAHPMKYNTRFETAKSVFGEAMTAEFLVDRIRTFGWRESMVRLAHLASIVANDEAGPLSPRACALTVAGIESLTASTPESNALLARGRKFVANANRSLVVAHEEALLFLQHLVLLHGSDESKDGPKDAEVTLWLLGASDHVSEWATPDDGAMTQTEMLVTELVKVHRFNRSEDSVRAALRADGLYGQAPWHAKLSGDAWLPLQQLAFGETFAGYFDSFVMPLFLLTHAWGSDPGGSDELPLLRAERFSAFGGEGGRFVERLRALTATREELRAEILKRMRPGDLLPHAPTALLHRPLIDLGEHGILAATPWYVRNFIRTGIWNRYREATKQTVGEKTGGEEWNRAFGQMFEEWVRGYATKVKASPATKVQIVLPTLPGAKDEIEDVVVIEQGAVVLFSVKGRMVREDIARYSLSRRQLLDWYEKYFFESKNDEFRGGALRQISARIDMLRRGDFEDRGISKNVRVHPVIVTYDSLCENQLLYSWLDDKCKEHGVLQQADVGKPVLAEIEEFERLIGVAADDGSIVKLLEKRHTAQWSNERLEVILGEFDAPRRLPGYEVEYTKLMQRMAARIGISPERIADAASRIGADRGPSSTKARR